MRKNRNPIGFPSRFKGTRFAIEVRFELVAPLVDDGHGRDRSSIAKWAESPAEHILGQILDVIDVLLHARALMEPGQSFLQPVSPFATGNAPAAALVLVELHYPQREFHHAGLIIEDHNATRAKELAAL